MVQWDTREGRLAIRQHATFGFDIAVTKAISDDHTAARDLAATVSGVLEVDCLAFGYFLTLPPQLSFSSPSLRRSLTDSDFSWRDSALSLRLVSISLKKSTCCCGVIRF